MKGNCITVIIIFFKRLFKIKSFEFFFSKAHGFLTADAFSKKYVHEFSFYTSVVLLSVDPEKGWRRDTLEHN